MFLDYQFILRRCRKLGASMANGREIVTIILRGRLKTDQRAQELRKVGVKARYRSRVGLACRGVVKGVYHLHGSSGSPYLCQELGCWKPRWKN